MKLKRHYADRYWFRIQGFQREVIALSKISRGSAWFLEVHGSQKARVAGGEMIGEAMAKMQTSSLSERKSLSSVKQGIYTVTFALENVILLLYTVGLKGKLSR